MKEINHIRTTKCEKCGKVFVPAPFHVYKDGSKYYCKWTCFNHRKDKAPEEVKENESN